MRQWKKYLNKQYYYECQIISAINSRYFYYGKSIRRKSKEYEALVDEFNCRKDGATSVSKLYRRFGLNMKRTKRFPVEFIGKCPIETGVILKGYYHSCLIIERKKDKIRVANCGIDDGWIEIKKFLKIRPNYSYNNYYIINKVDTK